MAQIRTSPDKRAFTLIELMVAISLAAILLGVVGFNFRAQSNRSSSKSVAWMLSEALRQAHLEAQAEQRPVAVVLPSEGGTRPHSTGFYVLRGYGQGKLVRMGDFSGDGNQGEMMVGVWPVGAPHSTSAGVPGPPSETIDLDTWIPPAYAKDYAFVFLPNGTVQTNDLPAFDGSYHILVASGFQYGATGAPPGASTVANPPSYFAPSHAADAFTVSLSHHGKVTVEPGVTGDTGSVITRPGPASAVSAAQTAPVGSATNTAPFYDQVSVTPLLDPLLLTPGKDAAIRVGDHLTLKVTADDAENDELFCEWKGSIGNFSAPGETRMLWDEDLQKRVSVWTWTPPSTANPGDSFTLTCTVRDDSGNVASPIAGSVIDVEAVEPGRIFYLRGRTPYACRPDGSGDRPLNTSALGNWREVHALPTTNRFCYSYIPPGGTDYEIWVANLDGSNPQRILAEPGAELNWARMNSQGTAIMYSRVAGGSRRLWICKGDGSNPQELAALTPTVTKWSSWAPDGRRFAYLDDVGNLWACTVDPDTYALGPQINLGPTTGVGHYMEWSNEVSSRLLVHGWNGATQFFDVVDPVAGTIVASLPPVPNVGSSQAYWSPDGSKLVYGNETDLWVINSDGTNAKHILSGPALDFPVWLP